MFAKSKTAKRMRDVHAATEKAEGRKHRPTHSEATEQHVPKSPKAEKKIGKVMGEFKGRTLHSGSKKGPKVINPKQAVAIALSEAREASHKKRK